MTEEPAPKPIRLPGEQRILDIVRAGPLGRVGRGHATLILEQARAIGDLSEPEPAAPILWRIACPCLSFFAEGTDPEALREAGRAHQTAVAAWHLDARNHNPTLVPVTEAMLAEEQQRGQTGRDILARILGRIGKAVAGSSP